jgi:hypothetical protein
MSERDVISVNISKSLIETLRKLKPSWKEIPATYIVDMLLREKLDEFKRRNELLKNFDAVGGEQKPKEA